MGRMSNRQYETGGKGNNLTANYALKGPGVHQFYPCARAFFALKVNWLLP